MRKSTYCFVIRLITCVLVLTLLVIILIIYLNFRNVLSPNNILTAVSILVSSSIVIAGWSISRAHEIEMMRRDKQLGFLENSYKKIAMGVMRDPRNKENKKFQEGLEEAIATIQLYGDKKLNETLVKTFPVCDPVLHELRASLRDELGLEKIEQGVIPLRTLEERSGIDEYNNKSKSNKTYREIAKKKQN